MLQTPFETEECLRKRQRVHVLSVRPFISESDVDSNGKAMKNYVFPVNKTSVNSSGDIVPMAFGKVHKYKNESQIF